MLLAQGFLKWFRAVHQQRERRAHNTVRLRADSMTLATDLISEQEAVGRGPFLFGDVQEYSVLPANEGKASSCTKEGGEYHHSCDLKKKHFAKKLLG